MTPLARGGTSDLSNYRLACHRCNIVKGDRLISELAEAITGFMQCLPPRWAAYGIAEHLPRMLAHQERWPRAEA